MACEQRETGKRAGRFLAPSGRPCNRHKEDKPGGEKIPGGAARRGGRGKKIMFGPRTREFA